MDNIKRISLWSGPRNISTTLMYAFAQRSDTQVFDEPLYAHYLEKSGAKKFHPGAEDILATMEKDGEKVVEMMLGNDEKPVLFFKNMTHHLLDLDRSFFKSMVHLILTRNPEEMLPSFDAVIENPSIKDVGYALHIDLIRDLEKMQLPYIVLDSTRILLDPENQLRLLCEKLEIPFEKNMLSWDKGGRPEDGIWAQYWYKNVHNSTCFIPYQTKSTAFPEHLKPLLTECQPHYDYLLKLAL